jgi:hypothetical protein
VGGNGHYDPGCSGKAATHQANIEAAIRKVQEGFRKALPKTVPLPKIVVGGYGQPNPQMKDMIPGCANPVMCAAALQPIVKGAAENMNKLDPTGAPVTFTDISEAVGYDKGACKSSLYKSDKCWSDRKYFCQTPDEEVKVATKKTPYIGYSSDPQHVNYRGYCKIMEKLQTSLGCEPQKFDCDNPDITKLVQPVGGCGFGQADADPATVQHEAAKLGKTIANCAGVLSMGYCCQPGAMALCPCSCRPSIEAKCGAKSG